jgi:signal transduction histidine kinase
MDLIETVLEYTRSEDQELDLSLSTVDIHAFLADVLAEYQPLAKQRGLTLVLETDPVLPLYTDRRILRLIVNNILAEALRTTQDGSIRVRTRSAGRVRQIEIQDTGPGFTEEERVTLFDPFHQPDIRQRQALGTSLGFALIQELVRALGGSLRIDSQVGKGTTVVLGMPGFPRSACVPSANKSSSATSSHSSETRPR